LQPELSAAYVVTRRGADIVFRAVAVIYGSSQGAFSHLVGEGDGTSTGSAAFRLLATVFFAALAGFASYVALNASFVALWVGRGFLQEHLTTLLIGIGFFSSSVRNMLLQILSGFGMFAESSKITLWEGVAKFLLSAVLIRGCGVAGAPLALIVSSSAALLLLWRRLEERVSLPPFRALSSRALCGTVTVFAAAEAIARLAKPAATRLNFTLSAAATLGLIGVLCLAFRWRAPAPAATTEVPR
jgi:O-antigen/teichoic acid export membrane protein